MNQLLKSKFHWSDWIAIGGLLLMAGLIYYGYLEGMFESRETFVRFIAQFGVSSVLIFLLIQMSQVILPIFPAALTCSAGVIVFGPFWGLLYNYIGIVLGSVGAFLIARRYGKATVQRLMSKQNFEKYHARITNSKRYERFFAVAIFAPLAPDDLLCYITGLTDMPLRKFTMIILLGKPLSIAFYSLGWATLVNWTGLFN